MYSVFKQQASASYDVVVPVVPVAGVPAPGAVRMPSRLEQQSSEPEKTHVHSQEGLVVLLNNCGQQAPSKTVAFPGRTTPAQVADPFVIRLLPVSGNSRLATTAGERRKSRGEYAKTTCRQCAYRERRAKATTSTGTDTETDQAELKRKGSRVRIWEPGRVDKQVAASGKAGAAGAKLVAVESPVTREDRGDVVGAAPDEIGKASGRRQPVEDAGFCHSDRMLTALVGGGLMLGSLLIAMLFLLVVGLRDKNAASAATTTEAKKPTLTEADSLHPLGKAYAQINPSQNEKADHRRRQQHSKNHTDPEPSAFSTTSRSRIWRRNPFRFFNTSETTWTFTTTERSKIQCKMDMMLSINDTFVMFQTAFSVKGFRANVTNIGKFEKLDVQGEKQYQI
ncbi:hypothetical protein MTO96_025312 [Rhipicephalus appendiculatus]